MSVGVVVRRRGGWRSSISLLELTTEIAAGDKCSPPVLVADSLGLGLPLGLRREGMLTWLWLLLKGVLLCMVRRG